MSGKNFGGFFTRRAVASLPPDFFHTLPRPVAKSLEQRNKPGFFLEFQSFTLFR